MKHRQQKGGDKKAKTQGLKIKPRKSEKFNIQKARKIMREVLTTKLEGKQGVELQVESKEIAESVRLKMRELTPYKPQGGKYKIMVQVMIGQNEGQGVQVGNRNFWDKETDYYCQECFINDEIFCLVIVYAVYYY